MSVNIELLDKRTDYYTKAPMEKVLNYIKERTMYSDIKELREKLTNLTKMRVSGIIIQKNGMLDLLYQYKD
jgi:hypothetical protein